VIKPFLDRLAAAPISWGVCEVPGWGLQLDPDRVLAEMRQLGFTHTELGADGWLPVQPAELTRVLARHGLDLLASFVPLVLHRHELAEDTRKRAGLAAERLERAGGTYFITAPVVSNDWGARYHLAAKEWSQLYNMLSVVGELCSQHNLTHVVHQHVGCVIETADEVRRLLNETPVALVLDSGHLAVGGFDPIELATTYATRIGLVHLKDTDLAVAAKLNRGELTLMQAVQAGLFPPLGQGDLAIAELVSALEAAGYAGWYVIEQDCAITGQPPPAGEGPIRAVEMSLEHLRTLNLEQTGADL